MNTGKLRLPSPTEREQFLYLKPHQNRAAWESAGASVQERSWLESGVRLPWLRCPPGRFNQGPSCSRASAAQLDFLQSELQRGLLSGALEPATSDRYVTRILLAPKGDKWRICFDLRHINKFLRPLTCRYETLRKLSMLARKGDYMISLDLKDGFYHFRVHPDDRQFLTFHVAGLGTFQYAVLPFGLSISPYVFTKLMRTFVRALRAPLAPAAAPPQPTPPPEPPPPPLRSGAYRPPHLRAPLPPPAASVISDLRPRFERLMRRGLRVLPYVDDFLILSSSYEEALEARDYVSAVLSLLGLSRNENKGVWEPTQMLTHLGMGVNTATGQFLVPPDRLAKLQSFSKDLICQACSKEGQGKLLKRRLAAFVGYAQSLHLAIPPARHYLRSLHDVMASTPGWSGHVRLTHRARRDLEWFRDLPARWNGRAIWRSPQTALLHCDASPLAWGGVLNLTVPARGFWSAHERRQHITFLELRAVRLTVETFVRKLQGRHVLLREDNQAVCAILTSLTSRSPLLMRELRRLWFLLDTSDITLHPRYIRSADNWWADALSRDQDHGDWRLARRWFLALHRDWGPFTVDRFASQRNTHLPRYNSAWMDPQTEGLDAFAQTNWQEENNWCNPPWDLLDRLSQLLDETGAAATVVAPCWPAQAWYQRLQAMSTDILHIPAAENLFSPGRQPTSGCTAPPRWSVICFRILARQPGPGNA